MTAKEKAILLGQAGKLYTLGRKVEKCREKLRQLVGKKVLYDSQQMIDALNEYEAVDSEWKRLEQEHLQYRTRLGIKDKIV
ncbi:hypothetical protein SDC9_64015 [bioreactor metagenome]|uniref:Uncharacterized protein n=1 Tax=bioreactor metagenome TaxID=1076179 RepID=A0A644XPE4_9ZZZZ